MRRFTLSVFTVMLAAGSMLAQSKPAAKTAAKTASKAATPAAKSSKVTGFSIESMDKTVEPCENFYQYACGGWRKNNPIPGDQSRWGRFNELAERNRNVLHEMLEKMADPKAKRTPLEAKVG